jgi:hypothetical protein
MHHGFTQGVVMTRRMVLILMLLLDSTAALAQELGPQTTAGDPASLRKPPAMDTVQVQLGAYDSRDEAHQALAGLRAGHPDLVGTRTALVIEAESGGQIFFRLRLARFGDLDQARALCEALVQRNVSCIPMTPR